MAKAKKTEITRGKWEGWRAEGQIDDPLPDQYFEALDQLHASTRTWATREEVEAYLADHRLPGPKTAPGNSCEREWTAEERDAAWGIMCSYEPAQLMIAPAELAKAKPEQFSAAGEPLADLLDGDEQPASAQPRDPFAPTRYLECILTPAEIEAMRAQREEGDAEIDRLSLKLEGLKKEAKSVQSRIDILLEDGLQASRTIRTGVVMRDVPCEERREIDERSDSPTLGSLIVVTHRLDTDEAIDWRELRRDERQGHLFDAAAPTPSNGVTQVREVSP